MRISDRIEIWASTVLSHLFSKYKNLQKSENPDFVDRENSIGVEVTSAVDSNVIKMESYYFNSLKNVEYENSLINSIRRFEKMNLKVTYLRDDRNQACGKPIGLLRVFGLEEFLLLHKAIQNKYAKNYEKLNQLDLYISFSQVCMDSISDDEFKNLLHTAHECEIAYGKVFSNIFIDFLSGIVILNVKTDAIATVKYNNDEVFGCFEKMIMEIENGKKER